MVNDVEAMMDCTSSEQGSSDLAVWVTCKFTRRFEPTGTEMVESLFLKESGVEVVSIVTEFLKMFEG